MSIAATAVPYPSTPTRKWPFPPAPRFRNRQSASLGRTLGDVRGVLRPDPARYLTQREKLCDVLMALAWGAAIPGVMWLGAAVGF
jgi:hypothetical protein